MQSNQHLQPGRIIIASLILYLFSTGISFAQDNDVTECPYFNVVSTDTAGVVFSLISTNVNATVSGVIANVEVEQMYLNAGDSTIDATYVFPMSSKAAVYGMEMIVNERTIRAEIRRKDEAQAIFDDANESGLTASLLEQERPNVFQMSLANINPGDSLKIRMVYTELLVPNNGVYQFVFPSIVGPRFTTGGEPWVYQSMLDSIPLSETALNINLKINAGMPVQATCASHDATFDNQGDISQTALSTHPGDDFIVNYTLDDNQIKTGLLLYEGEDENFFLSMIQPAKPGIPFDSPEREYVFIMDVSGSMSGQPLEVSKALISNMLADLNYDDKFNIIFFAGGSALLSPNSLPVTNGNINMALDMIDNQNAGGSTQLLPAMQTALNMQGTEGYSRTFVILTDGFVTVEKEAFELIRENLNKANFFAFGIGTSVNRYIIEGIAYVGEGEPFVVTDLADADEMAATFKEYIERPVLTNIETSFDGIDVYDVEPLTIPDVFAERPIIVYGKYHEAAEGNITITGDYAGGVVSSTLAFSDYTANADENIALKYLWARKRIKLMSDYGIASNENDTVSIEEEITQLGLQYSLVTEFTSFVAVDSQAVAATGTSDNPPDDGGGGVVEVDDVHSSEKELIKILGTIVDSEGLLKLDVENLTHLEYGNLSVQITNANGQAVGAYRLGSIPEDNIISLQLGQLPSGIYFVSLLSDSQVLDTERFVVQL
ncbi:MAG: VWA domain-containing protein [Lewinellaceae bacterium]|nr:VWA domain-containing protein [Phaeodactylibacter sp.]MCB9038737.1 VWA domain-containing protein [Lewinellaceae bacterium]